MRYNGFLAADINGDPAPGLFVGPGAGARSAESRPRRCRKGVSFEWTELTYQEILAGNSALRGVPAGDPAGVLWCWRRQYESLDAADRRSS